MVERRANAGSYSTGRKRRLLLVVDSDPDNLFYTSMLLKRFDYDISTAKTAWEALAITKVAVPSLIITALDLKDMNGLDLMRRFKRSPSATGVPFITLRRHGDLLGETRSFELGAVACFYQPVEADRLYLAVQTATEARPRTSIRLRTVRPVKVESMPLDGHEDMCTLDLSEHGMFLRAAEPAAANTRFSLQIDMEGRSIPAEAMVIYSYRTAGTPYLEPGMGLEFTRIAPRDQEFIRRFVRDEITRGIAPGNA